MWPKEAANNKGESFAVDFDTLQSSEEAIDSDEEMDGNEATTDGDVVEEKEANADPFLSYFMSNCTKAASPRWIAV